MYIESWVDYGESDTEFPLENLPVSRIRADTTDPKGAATIAVALGRYAFSVERLHHLQLLPPPIAQWVDAHRSDLWQGFLSASPELRAQFRSSLIQLFSANSPISADVRESLVRSACLRDQAPFLLPPIPNYTDFYAGIHHARHMGALFRPDAPLLPNYVHVPIGYHGRASSVRLSGEPVVRPCGQIKKPDNDFPVFGPSERLDYEFELGAVIGTGNALGTPIPISQAERHILGFVLLNDWSARDIQAWEYQPLGPFLSKSFCSTISPWVVMREALEPYKCAPFERGETYPVPLPYLSWDADYAYDISFSIAIQSEQMRAGNMPHATIAVSSTKHLFWTFQQLVTHHASNGCNLIPGDLVGSGTISGPSQSECGALIETTNGGKMAITLPSGETRTFLRDGDEVLFRAATATPGLPRIGFGECRGLVTGTRQG